MILIFFDFFLIRFYPHRALKSPRSISGDRESKKPTTTAPTLPSTVAVDSPSPIYAQRRRSRSHFLVSKLFTLNYNIDITELKAGII